MSANITSDSGEAQIFEQIESSFSTCVKGSRDDDAQHIRAEEMVLSIIATSHYTSPPWCSPVHDVKTINVISRKPVVQLIVFGKYSYLLRD